MSSKRRVIFVPASLEGPGEIPALFNFRFEVTSLWEPTRAQNKDWPLRSQMMVAAMAILLLSTGRVFADSAVERFRYPQLSGTRRGTSDCQPAFRKDRKTQREPFSGYRAGAGQMAGDFRQNHH